MRSKFVLATLLFLVFCVNAYGVKMSLPEVTADPNSTITVGISVDNAAGIAGGDVELMYDPSILTAKAARATTLAAGLSLAANPNTPGKVTFSMAGTTGLKAGSGALLEVDFQVIAASGKSSLTLSSVALFDENINTIPVDIVNGSVTVKAAPPPPPPKARQLTIADAVGNLGDVIATAVIIDDVVSVAGGDVVLLYDKAILEVSEVKVSALLAGVSAAVNKDVPGKISISMASTTGAKAGSGAILDITFKAISSGVANVTFESAALFNENIESISVETKGGKITVSGQAITATGRLSKLGVTTFMYGTHGLTVDNKLEYALKSATVNLDQYVDKNVTVKGTMQHSGLDGGPPLVDVASVEVIPTGPAIVKEHKSGEPMLALQATYNQANVHGHTYVDIWKDSIPVKKDSIPVKAGMFLEFQVIMFSGNPVFRGTVDLHTSDGGNLRDSGAKDQNDISAHPASDISKFARDKWYHRKISLDTIAGKTIDGVMIATDSSEHRAGVFRAYVDNIQITDGEYVLNYIWGDQSTEGSVPITGTNTANGTTFAGTQGMSDYSVTIVGETPVTPAGKLINAWGSIKNSK